MEIHFKSRTVPTFVEGTRSAHHARHGLSATRALGLVLGSLRNHDGNGDGNVTKQKN